MCQQQSSLVNQKITNIRLRLGWHVCLITFPHLQALALMETDKNNSDRPNYNHKLN